MADQADDLGFPMKPARPAPGATMLPRVADPPRPGAVPAARRRELHREAGGLSQFQRHHAAVAIRVGADETRAGRGAMNDHDRRLLG